MVQLLPTEFTYGKYDMCNLPWDTIKSTDSYIKWLLSQNIIGYCRSMECEIRPRPDDMAVMFEDEDYFQWWSHIPIDVFQKYLTYKKLV